MLNSIALPSALFKECLETLDATTRALETGYYNLVAERARLEREISADQFESDFDKSAAHVESEVCWHDTRFARDMIGAVAGLRQKLDLFHLSTVPKG